MRAAHPGADFLIHPECGCSTCVMEYVAAGDVDSEGVHMLSTGGMLDYAEHASRARRRSSPPRPGCCTRCAMAAPDMDFIAANEAAVCRYMKMITLPKLRDALRDRRRWCACPRDRGARRRADRAHGRDRAVEAWTAVSRGGRLTLVLRPAVRGGPRQRRAFRK